MRVVILIRLSPAQVYFSNEIVKKKDVVGVIVESLAANRFGVFIKKIKKHIQKWNILGVITLPIKIIDLVLIQLRSSYFYKAQKEFLFGKGKYELNKSVPHYKVRNINDKKTRDILKKLKPDLIVIFGTSIIKSPVIMIPKKGILNLHSGIVPLYRGSRSEFWALYNRDLKNVGSSVFLINEGLDTGDVLLKKRINVAKEDNELTLRCKNVVEGTKSMINAISMVEKGKIKGEKQKDAGKSYSTPSMLNYLQLWLRGKRWKRHSH